ncbi:hypothetical protein ELH26_30570 (plasmid) [Rhizobium leguminosarum]|uniref:hypothetical protein n=1 Tax=Rhizobium leguminosarum TaxID=384 RepID=UPI0010316E1B|nr:hypothetical protein [Rhizobium leguminosarum]TBC87275.1 hypothetical protein ELH26_30570 [Rhizobium leguminosarum]
MRRVSPMRDLLSAFIISSTLSAAGGPNAGAQTVEPGRCSKEIADIVATIDALMSQAKPNTMGYDELLRKKLPKGPCDIDAIRAATKQSPYFHWHKVGENSEMFRLSSKYLVSDFWIDLHTREIPKEGINVHVKKDEADYL